MIFGFGTSSVESLTIEPVSSQHSNALADIHAEVFDRGWTDGEFTELINKSITGGFVLRESVARGGTITGFVMSRTVAGEVEILTIAVRPNWQVLGCGRKLMDAVLTRAHNDRANSVFLEVNEHNDSARALYRKLGFAQVAMREGYYRQGCGQRAAALVMRRDLV